MRDYSVPIVTYLVEIDYAGARLHGRVFLPSHSDPREDEPRLEDWLNAPRWFFPFLPQGERETVLLNKAWITALALPGDGEWAAEGEGEGTDLAVIVEHGGRRTEGQIRVEMPPPRQRLLDVLNRPQAFLALRAEGRLVLVRKESITRMYEAEGLE